jgi:hypothetical protein
VLKRDGIDQLDRSREKFSIMCVKDERYVLHRIRRRKIDWIGHILRRYCRLERVIEGKMGEEVTGRRGRRHRRLLDDFEENRGYWKLKHTAIYRTVWRSHFF